MGLINLTPADEAILEAMKPVVEGIAAMSGGHTEVVLHGLDKSNPCIVKVANGHVTGRSEGAPVTDLAMGKLLEGQDVTPGYYTRTIDGKLLRSVTTIIRNGDGLAIGMLCINTNLDAPFQEVVGAMVPHPTSMPCRDDSPENFARNLDELLHRAVARTRAAVEADEQTLPSLKNKVVIEQLLKQGIFELKEAIQFVADYLGISHHTVYRHLRELKGRD
ncbi:PAS domain-containing protein [Endozoicomonas sp. Mp262]|uniref:helix-turn-helix transcriptional regulator n=1 Tax=Endozoicomonas sp. Mp262 TaxID=2919499 RepID=UPI0021DB649A